MPDFKCQRQGECFGRRPNGYCDVMTLSPRANKPCPFQKPKRFRKKDGGRYNFPDRQYIIDGSGKWRKVVKDENFSGL